MGPNNDPQNKRPRNWTRQNKYQKTKEELGTIVEEQPSESLMHMGKDDIIGKGVQIRRSYLNQIKVPVHILQRANEWIWCESGGASQASPSSADGQGYGQ